MTALPQIFAPQPSLQGGLGRTSTSEEFAPVAADRVEGRNSNNSEKRSDSQGMDRRFDEAMSEAKADKEPTKPSKEVAADKTPAARSENAPANKDEQTVSANTGSETGSDGLFTSLFAAAGSTADSSTDNTARTPKPDASAPVVQNIAPVTDTGPDAAPTVQTPDVAVKAPNVETPVLQQDAAIDAPLPAEITIPTTEGDIDQVQVPVRDEASSPKVIQSAETIAGQADARAAVDTDVSPEAATSQPETGEVKPNADIPVAAPATELAESGLDRVDDRRMTSDHPKLQSEAGNVRVAEVAVDQNAEAQPKTERAEGAAPQTVAAPIADNDPQITDIDMVDQKRAADKLAPVARTDADQAVSPRSDSRDDVKSGPQARTDRVDVDTIRSDRAYTAPSTADIIPDADRLMPLTSKPVSLAALADTVSLPGLSQAIPASTPLSPMIGSISGLSERLAATLLQNAQANPTVTLDKLPQAVVTVALSSRSATIQIDPPELGRIQLDYQFDNQGRTVVTLTPESEAARATLVDRMATITAALEQGSSSGVDVKLGDAQDFGTAFSDASDGDTGEDASSGSEGGPAERSPSDIDKVLAQRGHHIAEDGTSRLHMRV